MAKMHLTGGREHAVAVIDVGPGRASVAILSVTNNDVAKVVATGRSKLTLEARSPQQAVAQVGGHIQEAGEEALRSYTGAGHHAAIAEAYVVVHAPWVTTQSIHAAERYDDEEVVHERMIWKLAYDALSDAANLDHSRLLEATLLQVQLNGYTAPQPAGKQAHKIEVMALASECEPAAKEAIAAAVQKVFPVGKPVWRTAMRALMKFARARATQSHRYLIVDMGVETTHIVSVRGAAFEQRTVPQGVRSILSRISGGKLPDEVLGSLHMLERGACSTEACEAIQKALSIAEPEFVRAFADPIGQMAATRRAPNDLLLVTHPDLEPWLSRLFSRIDFSQFTVTTLPFTVSTPSSVGMDRWLSGDISKDSLAVASALVNIEARV